MTPVPPPLRPPLPADRQGPYAAARPGMQGRYLLRSARSARAMAWLDRALSLVPVRRPVPPARLDRVLLANWGHLGDVVTTLGLVQALRDRHPGIDIGMIVAASARAAIEESGLVDRVHIVDHWWVSRAARPRAERKRHFRQTRDRALRDIRACRYQAAVDLYPFFPPAHPLFFKAGIPIRVGFVSGGFSPLLTHPVPWPDARVPVAEQYRGLLDALHPHAPFPADALRPRRDRATLAPRPPVLAQGGYVLLHPGAGAAYKEWGVANWIALAHAIAARAPDTRIVLTGAGASECAMAVEIADACPGVVDMAGKADWEGFVAIVAGAAIVVCPDTATGHAAAAVGVPVVSIFTGTNIAEQWQPYTADSRLLVQPVLCAPCNQAGCAAMACVRLTRPEQVLAAMCDLGWPGAGA